MRSRKSSHLLGPAAVVIAIAWLGSMTHLRAEQSKAKIVGLGATNCPQFLRETPQSPDKQRNYLAWAQGFMSGVLLGRPAGVDEGLDLNPPTFGLLRQLDYLYDFCRQHPSEGFSDGVLELYKRLRKEGAT